MLDVRGRNEGTIYFRADRKAKVAKVILPGGRPLTESCPHRNHKRTDRDCAESRAALTRLLEQRDGRRGDPRKIRLGAYLTRWASRLSTAQLAPATIRGHRSIVANHLVPALGNFTMAELSPADVDDYLRLPGLDPRTRSHHRATLRRALQDAVREGLIDRNAGALAHPPAVPHRERATLTAAQVARLLDGTRGSRYHALYALGAVCGLRIGEALGLRWSVVDLERGSLAVRESLTRDLDGQLKRKGTKTAKGRRTVDLPAIAADALREHRAIQDAERGAAPRPIDSLVFLTPAGYPIHGSNVLPFLYRDLARLGLPRVTFHELRHSAATILYALGVPIETIADMLGHSSTRITADLYRHRSADLAKDAAERMQAALEAASGYQRATSAAGLVGGD